MKEIDQIKRDIDWLDQNKKSNNIVAIAIVLDSLAIQSARLGELKADAFDLMSDAEDDYKQSIAEFVAGQTGTAAKLEREVYKGKMHEELLWAELQPTADGRIKIVWEDNWQQPVFCNDLAQAKSSVIAEHGNHKPHINGRSYEIG